MPLDVIPQGKMTLADLSWRLRHPETWPPGFEWDFKERRSCAVGLYCQLTGRYQGAQSTSSFMGLELGIPHGIAYGLFIVGTSGRREMWRATDVADAIDAVLARETADAV